MDCRRYGGSMIELARRRMMMSNKKIVPLEYATMDKCSIVGIPILTTGYFTAKIRVTRRDTDNYPTILVGNGSYDASQRGRYRFLFGIDNVYAHYYYYETYNRVETYDFNIVENNILVLPKREVRATSATLSLSNNSFCSDFFEATFTDLNNVVVRKIIPVRVGNECKLFDIVSGNFYENRNPNGTMTPGPDKTA